MGPNMGEHSSTCWRSYQPPDREATLAVGQLRYLLWELEQILALAQGRVPRQLRRWNNRVPVYWDDEPLEVLRQDLEGHRNAVRHLEAKIQELESREPVRCCAVKDRNGN